MRKKGFTLIELIIVTAIVSVISLAIFSTLNNGLKIWRRAKESIAEEDVCVFLDKFASDLRNSLIFEGIDFFGQDDKLEFPTLVKASFLGRKTIGMIIYSYDSNKKALLREQRDFSQVYSDHEGIEQRLLENVESAEFQYYYYDSHKQEYLWYDEARKDEFPLAVRLEFEFSYGGERKTFVKTISIPVGGTNPQQDA